MKTILSILGLALVCWANASAQVVTVKLTTDQGQFLPGESLPVTVQIINNSGQTLHLGADPNWLMFNVESKDDSFVVEKKADPPVVGAFTLGSSEMATKRVDLAPYFVMTKQGRYRVVATVHIPEWGTDVTSPALKFDVVDAAHLWSQAFGVPAPPGVTNQPPVIRKYILEEANYLQQQLRMYVLVTDQSESHVFKVSAIGPMVNFSRPEAQLDSANNLHLIYQSGARSFIYSVINPAGVITKREIYDYVGTRPRLGFDAAGNVVEVGGVRRSRPEETPPVITPNELPPAAPAKQ